MKEMAHFVALNSLIFSKDLIENPIGEADMDIIGFCETLQEIEVDVELVAGSSPNQRPLGTLGIFIPKFKLVINIPDFLFGMVQASLGAAYVLFMNGKLLDVSNSGGLPLLTGIRDIINSFNSLDEKKAEYCVYKAIWSVSCENKKLLPQFASQKKIYKKHKEIRVECPISECPFNQKGCKMKKNGFIPILKNLESKKLLVREYDNIRPII